MRNIAVALLLAAVGVAGYLFWMERHQTSVVVPSGEVKTVSVDNFAYGSPELVKPDHLKIEAPIVHDDAVAKTTAADDDDGAPLLEPVNESKLAGLSCVVFGPLPEKQLPKYRRFFEKVDVMGQLTIIPYSDTRYAVYVGPFTRQKARKSLEALCRDAAENCSIAALEAGGHALVVETFADEKSAELWSKKFALDNGLTNVRVTRYNNVAVKRVALVFNGVGEKQVRALLKRSKAEKIGLSVCPKEL